MFHVEQDPSQGFAKRLKQARLDAGARRGSIITQTEIAEAMKVSQVTVGRWESGESEPDLATIKKLAKVLGADPRDLAFGPAVNDEPAKKRRAGGS